MTHLRFELISLLKKGFMKNYRVAPYETDETGKLKIGSIFNYLQDSMDEYSTALKVGPQYCQRRGMSYALRGYDVAVSDLPQRGVAVPVHTKLACVTPYSFVLQQTMYDPSLKQSLLSSCSQVILLSAETGRFLRTKDVLPFYIMQGVPAQNYSMSAIANQTRIDRKLDVTVPWDYIDFNKHMNNTKYIEMATRTLSPAQLKEMKLRRIAAIFKNSAKCGEQLQVQTQIEPWYSVHNIVSTSNAHHTCAKVYLEWQKEFYHEKIKSEEKEPLLTAERKENFALDKQGKKHYNPPTQIRRTNGYVY